MISRFRWLSREFVKTGFEIFVNGLAVLYFLRGAANILFIHFYHIDDDHEKIRDWSLLFWVSKIFLQVYMLSSNFDKLSMVLRLLISLKSLFEKDPSPCFASFKFFILGVFFNLGLCGEILAVWGFDFTICKFVESEKPIWRSSSLHFFSINIFFSLCSSKVKSGSTKDFFFFLTAISSSGKGIFLFLPNYSYFSSASP